MFSTKKSLKRTNEPLVPELVLGLKGEDAAEVYLKKNGFKVLLRNFRCRGGEIDLIAEKKGELHFVEVKTRKDLGFGNPYEAIGYTKQTRISRAAQYFIMKNSRWSNNPKVFSVMSVNYIKTPPEIDFISNAFEMVGDCY